jgi:hypothetical protein
MAEASPPTETKLSRWECPRCGFVMSGRTERSLVESLVVHAEYHKWLARQVS